MVRLVGVCGYCSSMQGYSPDNMLLIADHPDLAHDVLKEDGSHKNPDVYPNDTWFCQGCGSGTSRLVDADNVDENGRETR